MKTEAQVSQIIRHYVARIRELEASLRVAEENEEDRARQVAEGDARIRELEAMR